MYYRSNNGWGCLILMLIGFLCLSAMLKILFTPAFWIVIAIIFVISWIQRLLNPNGRDDSEEYTEYNRGQYNSASGSGSDFDSAEYSEGTDDPNRMEEVYESNAVDVDDVEVIRDDDVN